MRERTPLLAAAAASLTAAAVKAWNSGLDSISAVLGTAGLIVLGCWITVEVQRYHDPKE